MNFLSALAAFHRRNWTTTEKSNLSCRVIARCRPPSIHFHCAPDDLSREYVCERLRSASVRKLLNECNTTHRPTRQWLNERNYIFTNHSRQRRRLKKRRDATELTLRWKCIKHEPNDGGRRVSNKAPKTEKPTKRPRQTYSIWTRVQHGTQKTQQQQRNEPTRERKKNRTTNGLMVYFTYYRHRCAALSICQVESVRRRRHHHRAPTMHASLNKFVRSTRTERTLRESVSYSRIVIVSVHEVQCQGKRRNVKWDTKQKRRPKMVEPIDNNAEA